MFRQRAISTVLLIVSRLRQSRVSTACFSVITEYIKTIALFLLGAGLLSLCPIGRRSSVSGGDVTAFLLSAIFIL
jgi:hypothetical protein